MTELADYLEALASNLKHILTEQQRNKFCLIFGTRVIGVYNSREEAMHAQDTTYSCLLTSLYIPIQKTVQN